VISFSVLAAMGIAQRGSKKHTLCVLWSDAAV
jgi:hypothetical protein